MIPRGLCQCGCGSPTPIARLGNAKRGYEAGGPVRFLLGHQNRHRPAMPARIHSAGYVLVRRPEHARASNAYVYEHILVAERALRKPLPAGAEVHHVNGRKADNRGANLVICQDLPYHRLLHRRLKALRACGHPDWVKCYLCGQWEPPGTIWTHPSRTMAYHRACVRERDRRRRCLLAARAAGTAYAEDMRFARAERDLAPEVEGELERLRRRAGR